MNCTHDNKVNNMSEGNLLHVMLNPSKRIKIMNSNYSPILHVCMNTCKGKEKFNIVLIILDSGCSSTIVNKRLIKKLNHKKDAVM